MARENGGKVVMIGIDACDIDFIESSLEHLPRFQQLFADHPPVRTESTAGTLTSTVWPTFATGRMPGEHGVYYPMQWDAAAMKLRRVTPDWLSYEPFWYELARQGRKVTVLDMPFSLPSKLENGVEILNWGSQECIGPYQTNDPNLSNAFLRRFGKHPMGNDVPVEESPARLEVQRNNLVAGAKLKGEASRWLMEQTEWDLFVTVFAECHRGGHLFWPEAGGKPTGAPTGALLEVYQAVDAAIGHVLDGVDLEQTAVVVFSVHGMRANYTQEHFILPAMERINAAYDGGGGGGEAKDDEPPKEGGFNPIRMLRAAVPGRLQALLAQALPDSVRDWVVQRSLCGGLDWSKTRGFAIIASCEGYLRLNLKGREGEGLLDRGGEECQKYVSFVKQAFMELVEPHSGLAVVKDVVSMADHFPGPKSDLLPDLVILWNDVLPATEIRSERLGRLFGKLTTGRIGEHQPIGFLTCAGDRSRLEQAPAVAHNVDYAQFIRSLMGVSAQA